MVTVVVQYKVEADKVYDAYYTLDNSRAQIQAYVFDSVGWSKHTRSSIPRQVHLK
jgi:hypothetical protein